MSISPRRDPGKPLVEVGDNASAPKKALVWVFCSYLIYVVAIGILAVVAGIIFLLTL